MKTNLASWSRGRLIAVIASGLVLLHDSNRERRLRQVRRQLGNLGN